MWILGRVGSQEMRAKEQGSSTSLQEAALCNREKVAVSFSPLLFCLCAPLPLVPNAQRSIKTLKSDTAGQCNKTNDSNFENLASYSVPVNGISLDSELASMS